MYSPDFSDFNQFDTQDLWQKDIKHVIHPQVVWPTMMEKGCTVLVKGEGIYVYDSDGNRYLDSNGGLWSVNIGYGREEMALTIAEQARMLPMVNHYGD